VSDATGPRLPPLPRDRFDDDVRTAVRAVFPPEVAERFLSDEPGAPPVPNVLGMLMHHPALSRRFLAYNFLLLEAPALGHRWRELVVLRVAWRTRCSYEWAQHVRLAATVGVTPGEIDAIAQGAAAGTWSPVEADLLAATDQLLDHHRIDDDTWARLAGELDERQLVEAVFVAGTYACLAMAFNSFGVELDPDLAATTTDPFAEPPAPSAG
jgi:4-carboxymuconolactone decarboxylase